MYSGGAHRRRDRTFIGAECAACEESLELKLHGERIIQLMCGHVSHEACFYEYIKEFEAQTCPSCDAPLSLDATRGGASIDFQNLNRLVRSLQRPSDREDYSLRQPPVSLPRAVEFRNRVLQTQAIDRCEQQQRVHHSPTKSLQTPFSPYQTRNQHHHVKMGQPIFATETNAGRDNDLPIDQMEAATTSTNQAFKQVIPPPTVTVRSEFPSVTRSQQRQSLTCLVTVEVVESRWQIDPRECAGYLPSTPDSLSSHLKPPRSPFTKPISPVDSVYGDASNLDQVRDELFERMDYWHGMEYAKFGSLVLHGRMRVGKDGQSWQDLKCYLFTEMLICVKERKLTPDPNQEWNSSDVLLSKPRYALKGSILVKKHLRNVDVSQESGVLTLNLSVVELPKFHLQFASRHELEKWRDVLNSVNRSSMLAIHEAATEQNPPGTTQDINGDTKAPSGFHMGIAPPRIASYGTEQLPEPLPSAYSSIYNGTSDLRLPHSSLHIPLDIVVVVPLSSSMQGLKSNILRDTLRFLVSNLGERDRMGLVTFGSRNACDSLVDMTTKSWSGWSDVLDSVRPTSQENLRADPVEGTRMAMDMLIQQKSTNPLASILLISDSSSIDHESVDIVLPRAESAKIPIHSFGLGLAHHPDMLVELSTRTNASYTYVMDWMMLRECLAGCLGSLQSLSHQDVKLKLRLPSGSPTQFVKISGGLGTNKRASGRDVEIVLGDLRFGDKRDILVQLIIAPTTSSLEITRIDSWSNVVAGLEALGDGRDRSDTMSAEDMPLLQADLIWGDLLSAGKRTKMSQPSLLAIPALPPLSLKSEDARLSIPAVPPHPSIVQRRMELLSSDMLSRALLLVSQGKHDRAQHLLAETRSILKGLAKGSLPPLPPPPSSALPPTPPTGPDDGSSRFGVVPPTTVPRTPSPGSSDFCFSGTLGVDTQTMLALDHELGTSVEWISHPSIFGRDSREAILQAIGTISTQRAYTFRTPAESLWAASIPGVRLMTEASGEWRETVENALAEEF